MLPALPHSACPKARKAASGVHLRLAARPLGWQLPEGGEILLAGAELQELDLQQAQRA